MSCFHFVHSKYFRGLVFCVSAVGLYLLMLFLNGTHTGTCDSHTEQTETRSRWTAMVCESVGIILNHLTHYQWYVTELVTLGTIAIVHYVIYSRTIDLKLFRRDGAYLDKEKVPVLAGRPGMVNAMDAVPEQLNEPWKLYNMDRLKDADECRKVWIMGRYKVGKSSILRWLGVDSAEPASLVNTRGELFLTDPSWPGTMFVDTEGFDQPINTTEPEFRKHFILQHSFLAADAVILVFPQLLVSDLQLFIKNIRLYLRTRKSLIIIHNVPVLKTKKELKHYKSVLKQIFTFKDINVKVKDEDFLLISHHQGGMDVKHIFLGSELYLSSHNRAQLEEVRSSIMNAGHSKASLVGTLKTALKQVSSKAYIFGDEIPNSRSASAVANGDNAASGPLTPVRTTGDSKSSSLLDCNYDAQSGKLTLNRRILSTQFRLIAENFILGNAIDYRWQSVFYRESTKTKKKVYYQPLIVGLNRLEYNSLNFSIEQEHKGGSPTNLIVVDYIQYNALHDGSINSEISGRELIYGEMDIDLNQELEKTKLQSNECCVLVRLNQTVEEAMSEEDFLKDAKRHNNIQDEEKTT